MEYVQGLKGRKPDYIYIRPPFRGHIDDVRNGIALSPTYHRAFDFGLIYVDQEYVMRINPQKEAQIQLMYDRYLPTARILS